MTSIRTDSIIRENFLRISSRLTEVWETDNEVGEYENCRAVEAIGTVFDVSCVVFQVTRDICHSHERHEGSTKELLLVSTIKNVLGGVRTMALVKDWIASWSCLRRSHTV